MGSDKRTFRIDIDKKILDKVEEQFCYASVNGELVRVRSLTSVCTEAFLTGVLCMTEDLELLREQFGPSIYLKAKGIGFAELSLDEPRTDDDISRVVQGTEH